MEVVVFVIPVLGITNVVLDICCFTCMLIFEITQVKNSQVALCLVLVKTQYLAIEDGRNAMYPHQHHS